MYVDTWVPTMESKSTFSAMLKVLATFFKPKSITDLEISNYAELASQHVLRNLTVYLHNCWIVNADHYPWIFLYVC